MTNDEALDEMVQFQKEFKVFSPQHTLQMSFGLLNIAPVGEADRAGFFRYLKLLKGTLASVDGKASRKNGCSSQANPTPSYCRFTRLFYSFCSASATKPTAERLDSTANGAKNG